MTGSWRLGNTELLILSALMIPLGLIADSITVSAIGALLAWVAVSALLPKGGASVAFAVACLWTNAAVVASKIHGAPTFAGLLPIVVLGALAVSRIVGREQGVVVSPAFRMLLVHGAALALATLFAINASIAFTSLQTFVVEGLVLWFVVLNAIDSRENFRLALIAVVSAAAFLGVVSLVQFLTESYGNDFAGFAQLDQDRIERLAAEGSSNPKLAGSIGEQNRYGQILVVVIPLALALSYRWVRRPIVPILAVVPITAGVVLTSSRGAAVALVVTLVAMAGLRLVTLRALVVIVGAVMVLFLVVPGYQDRLTNTIAAAEGTELNENVDGSTLSRLAENIAAYNIAVDNPVFGVGPGGYPPQYERYAERVGLNVREGLRQPHNLYLGVAAEIGVIGLITFMLVASIVLWRLLVLWWRARNTAPDIAALAAGFLCAIGAYMVSGIFLHLAFERYYWMLLALADAATRVGTHELHRDPLELETSSLEAVEVA